MVWALEMDFLPVPTAAAGATLAEGVASVREEELPFRRMSDATPPLIRGPVLAAGVLIAAPPAVEGSNVALLAAPVLLRPPLARPPVLPAAPAEEALVVVDDVPLMLLPLVDAVLLKFASLDRYAISSAAAPDAAADGAPEAVADPGGGGLLSVMARTRYGVSMLRDMIVEIRPAPKGQRNCRSLPLSELLRET